MAEFFTSNITYYIAHNSADIFHYGIVTAGKKITTGQPTLETFLVQSEWETRLLALGIIQQDIDNVANSTLAQELVISEAEALSVSIVS